MAALAASESGRGRGARPIGASRALGGIRVGPVALERGQWRARRVKQSDPSHEPVALCRGAPRRLGRAKQERLRVYIPVEGGDV